MKWLRYDCIEGCGFWEVNPNSVHAVQRILDEVIRHRSPAVPKREHHVEVTLVER
jgi:hypothetical protein